MYEHHTELEHLRHNNKGEWHGQVARQKVLILDAALEVAQDMLKFGDMPLAAEMIGQYRQLARDSNGEI
jgi:hypothetical protein